MMKASLWAAHPDAPSAKYVEGVTDEDVDEDALSRAQRALHGNMSNEEFKTRRQQFRARMSKNERWHSTKMDKALSIIQKQLCSDLEGKVLVFSFSLALLDILNAALDYAAIPCIRYDDTTQADKRKALENDFETLGKGKPIQSTAGGLGSNFVAATTVIILTPEWAKTKESQCACRADRMGQKKQVTIFRILAKESMDVRVLEKQNLKVSKENRLMDLNRTDVDEPEQKIQDEIRSVAYNIRDMK